MRAIDHPCPSRVSRDRNGPSGHSPLHRFDSTPREIEGQWYTLRIEAVGSALEGHVDDELVLDDSDSELSFGSIGVCASNADAVFDDVRAFFP